MAQVGCEHCGIVLNRLDAHSEAGQGRMGYPCPECGRWMRAMGLREALDLAGEREEAMSWRARRGAWAHAAASEAVRNRQRARPS